MTERDKQELVAIISSYLPNARIILFGSRARGDTVSGSDIDIALDNKTRIDVHTIYAIKEAFEETRIPFTVDVIDLHAVSEMFKQQIFTEGLIWKMGWSD